MTINGLYFFYKMAKKKETGADETIIGVCSPFEAGKNTPTGLTWKELALLREKNIREDFGKMGIESPTLEMMYCKGRKYVRTLRPNSSDDFQVDVVFYLPKPSAKSYYKEIIYERVRDVKGYDEKQFIIESTSVEE